LAIAQAAATPKTRLSGTAIAATSSVSRMAASASGSAIGREIGADAPAKRLDEDGDQRQHQEQRRGNRDEAAISISASAPSAASVGGGDARGRGRRVPRWRRDHQTSAIARGVRDPACRLIDSSMRRRSQHHAAIAVAPA
jgi:hypothetical protein